MKNKESKTTCGRKNTFDNKISTVKPDCNGHPWDLKKVAVLKEVPDKIEIQTGRQ